jgi:hypothetical protein
MSSFDAELRQALKQSIEYTDNDGGIVHPQSILRVLLRYYTLEELSEPGALDAILKGRSR